MTEANPEGQAPAGAQARLSEPESKGLVAWSPCSLVFEPQP